jgi:hypothetical protein
MSPVLAKLVRVSIVAGFAFLLGGYSFELSGACTEVKGGGWAWAAVILSIVGLAFGAFLVVRDAARPSA